MCPIAHVIINTRMIGILKHFFFTIFIRNDYFVDDLIRRCLKLGLFGAEELLVSEYNVAFVDTFVHLVNGEGLTIAPIVVFLWKLLFFFGSAFESLAPYLELWVDLGAARPRRLLGIASTIHFDLLLLLVKSHEERIMIMLVLLELESVQISKTIKLKGTLLRFNLVSLEHPVELTILPGELAFFEVETLFFGDFAHKSQQIIVRRFFLEIQAPAVFHVRQELIGTVFTEVFKFGTNLSLLDPAIFIALAESWQVSQGSWPL